MDCQYQEYSPSSFHLIILFIFILNLFIISYLEQYRMIFKPFSFLFLFLASNCISFQSFLLPLGQRCFYQMLDSHQKYLFDFYPQAKSNFTLTIEYLNKENKSWINELSRQLVNYDYLNVHKLAGASSTYRFCISNNMKEKLKYEIEIKWGLELLELKLLPDNSDSQTILTEMQWLKEETGLLLENEKWGNESAERFERVESQLACNLFRVIVLFILAVSSLNVWFYLKIKKEMNKRKMI